MWDEGFIGKNNTVNHCELLTSYELPKPAYFGTFHFNYGKVLSHICTISIQGIILRALFFSFVNAGMTIHHE
jgi:hypothetical protein